MVSLSSPESGSSPISVAARGPTASSGSLLGDLVSAARLAGGLPRFFRRPAPAAEAQATIRQRLERRRATFLELMRRAIFARPGSPYERLLRMAGCELGDLVGLVEREGVEGALGVLYRAGVFLRVEEAKGRQPVVRGGERFTVRPGDLRNPLLATHFRMHTGGSGGAPATIPIDLATIRDRAVNRRILLQARGGLDATYVEWGVPGSQTLFTVLEYACAGLPVRHWLLKVDPASPELHAAYRWSLRLTQWASLVAGRPLARPEHVPPDRAIDVARRMAAIIRAGDTVWYNGTVSGAVAIATAALEAGVDLRGARFAAGSEAMTEARQAAIRRAGVSVVVGYGTTETSRIGYGCLHEAAVNDVHVLGDLNAVIQPGPARAGDADPPLPPRALLLTPVSLTAPLVALNLSLGDQGWLDEHDCGCPYRGIGWTTRLRAIESFEKLKAAGMTFLDTDVIRILEADLPARFGGGPTDYQLVEEEQIDGRTRVLLVVHPRVGDAEPAAIAAWFLDRLGQGSGAERIMAMTWKRSDTLAAVRGMPRATAAGKILPVIRKSSHVATGRPAG